MIYKKVKKENIKELIKILENTYPDAKCSLNYSSPFELTIALILAAQSTDATVNVIVPKLLAKYPTPDKLATAHLLDVEKIIKPTGFYHNKAKHVINTSRLLATRYPNSFPDTMPKLLKLHGIRKKV